VSLEEEGGGGEAFRSIDEGTTSLARRGSGRRKVFTPHLLGGRFDGHYIILLSNAERMKGKGGEKASRPLTWRGGGKWGISSPLSPFTRNERREEGKRRERVRRLLVPQS